MHMQCTLIWFVFPWVFFSVLFLRSSLLRKQKFLFCKVLFTTVLSVRSEKKRTRTKSKKCHKQKTQTHSLHTHTDTHMYVLCSSSVKWTIPSLWTSDVMRSFFSLFFLIASKCAEIYCIGKYIIHNKIIQCTAVRNVHRNRVQCVLWQRAINFCSGEHKRSRHHTLQSCQMLSKYCTRDQLYHQRRQTTVDSTILFTLLQCATHYISILHSSSSMYSVLHQRLFYHSMRRNSLHFILVFSGNRIFHWKLKIQAISIALNSIHRQSKTPSVDGNKQIQKILQNR